MKNLLLIALFTTLSTAAFSQKEVKVEKEIINGSTVTRVWIDGQEVEEGTDDYQKYAAAEGEKQGKGRKRKKRNKGSKNEEVIIIKEVEEVEIVENESDNGKIIIVKVQENKTDSSSKHNTVNVEVTAENDGQKKVIIKKMDNEGKEEVEEILINSDNDKTIINSNESTVIVKTKIDTELDMEGIDPENIESVNVIKNENESKIIIKTKDGKVIVKEIKQQNEGKGNNLKIEKIESTDLEFGDIKPEDIETIDVKETDNEKTVTIKTKDGKTIIKKIKTEKKQD